MYAMKLQKRARAARYIRCFLIACAVAAVLICLQNLAGKTTKERLQTLHDAFFATGAFCILAAGLSHIDGAGGLLGIGYTFVCVKNALMPLIARKKETYAQYRQRKLNGKRTVQGNPLWLVGILFLIISIAVLFIWKML